MVLDTRRNIGNADLAMAIAYFGSNGYTVSVPLNDTQDYDLVVDMGGDLKKVQVKATNSKHSANSYSLLLKTVSGTTRKVYKTVVDTDIDYLFCLCGDGTMFLIPKEEIKNRNTLCLSTSKSKYASKGSVDYSKYVVSM